MNPLAACLLLGALVVSGCGRPAEPKLADPPAWRLDRPASWESRVRELDDPAGATVLAGQGIRSGHLFEYLPQDTTIVPQFLLGIWVYDSASWAGVAAEEGPPQGDVLTTAPGWVYVAGLPQSNPFAPGSVDSVEFDRRAVTLEQVKVAFRLTPAR